jgi:hypothetical protein
MGGHQDGPGIHLSGTHGDKTPTDEIIKNSRRPDEADDRALVLSSGFQPL